MSESELAVDQLLARLTRLDRLSGRLEQQSTSQESEDSEKAVADEARQEVNDIQTYIYNHRELLPAYIRKKAQDRVKPFEELIHKPIKMAGEGFKFKKKKQPTESVDSTKSNAPKTTREQEPAVKSGSSIANHLPQSVNSVGFSGLRDSQELSLEGDQVFNKDINLLGLENCSVEIKGSANTIYIKNLTSCKVRIGLASRAVLLSNCSKCEFTLACQQLRIDSSTDCSFELYVSSRAMLENSKNLSFSQLRWTFDGLDDLFVRANFQKDCNNWKKVDDFDWLSPDTKSKNYQIVE